MANNEHRGSTPMAVTPGYWNGNIWVQATAATPFPVEVVSPSLVVNNQVEGQQSRDDALVAGSNPVLMGARGSIADPSPVGTDGDLVDLSANRRGALRVTPEPAASATQVTVSIDTTAGGIEVKAAAETTLKAILLVNNGAVDCYGSFSGTVVSGAAAAANGGFVLKANGVGVLLFPEPGALSIKLITAASSTIVAVSKIS